MWWSNETHGLGCGYKEWGNIGCSRNPIVVYSSILCNICYGIIERVSLIHGYRHGRPNHVNLSCIIV